MANSIKQYRALFSYCGIEFRAQMYQTDGSDGKIEVDLKNNENLWCFVGFATDMTPGIWDQADEAIAFAKRLMDETDRARRCGVEVLY